MNDTPYTREDDHTTELKSLIRRVRSLAGARRFGQSIGSIIKIDASPDAASRRKAKKPDLPSISNGGVTPTRIISAQTAAPWVPTEDNPFPVFYAADIGLDPAHVPTVAPEDFRRSVIELPEGVDAFDYRHPDSPVRFVMREVATDDPNHFWSLQAFDHELERKLGAGTAMKPFWSEVRYVPPVLDDHTLDTAHRLLMATREKPAVVRTVVEDRFREQGYSLPWLTLDPKSSQMVSKKNDVERIRLAHERLEKMGVEMSSTEAQNFSPVAIETLAMAHDEMLRQFPDWNAYVSRYITFPDKQIGKGKVMAWNAGFPENDGSGSMHHIGLNASVFGRDATDPIYQATARSSAEGHWSVDSVSDVMENTGLGKDHAAAMVTIMHELGHTIGRSLTGVATSSETYMNRLRRKDALNVGSDEGSPLQEVIDKYSDELASETQFMILQYGLSDYANDAYDVTPHDMRMTTLTQTGWPLAILPNKELGKHLSSYGMSSIDEMFAEAWTAYTLMDTPTQFAYEYGNFLYQSFADLTSEPEVVKALRG